MKILVVDDDSLVMDAIVVSLHFHWPQAQVLSALDSERGLQFFFDESPDMTLLDINMPYMGGFEFLERARELSSRPIIILTGREDESSKIKALELGADDYLVKPFGHLELIARIRAVLRRSEISSTISSAPALHLGEITIDFEKRLVFVKGQVVSLTPTEYKLIYHLGRNAGRILSADTLLSKVWGEDYRRDLDYLKTYISRLRKKLGDDPEHPRYIITERSIGYRLGRPPTHMDGQEHGNRGEAGRSTPEGTL